MEEMDKTRKILVLHAACFVSFSSVVIFSLHYITKDTSPQWNKNKNAVNISTIHKGHFICPKFIGGLGNQMFQYASSYGIARLKDMNVVIHRNCFLLKVFKLQADIKNDISVCSLPRVKIIQEAKSCSFDKKMIEFDTTSDVRLTTHLESYVYFEKYKIDLRKQFKFKENIRVKATELLDLYLRRVGIYRWHESKWQAIKPTYVKENNDNITLVGIHVRRGDYVSLRSEIGYNTASGSYLQKATLLYMSKYRNVVFVVASNGMDWTKRNMPKNVTAVYLQGNSAALDMAIITLTKHFIATVGSYSWWAAWLTGGSVTYFKWPAIEGTRARKSYSKTYDDFYYKSWIGL